MRKECDTAALPAPRRVPTTAWLLAAAPPSPWYAQLLAIAMVATFAFVLLRRLYRSVARKRHHPAPLTLRWSGTADDFKPDSLRWALATALVFSVRNGDAWDRLRLDEPVEQARRSLHASWGIHDRTSLMKQLRSLLQEGHRSHLQPMVRHFANLPAAQYAEIYAQTAREPDHEDKRERLWQMAAAHDNRDDIRYVDFLAWDLVRYIWLCRLGVHLGYLEEAEAPAMLLTPARLLQQRYRSWEDCATQFMQARAFWAGGDPEMEASQQAVRDTLQLLRKDRHSPWKLIDWAMPLGDTSA